MFEIIKFKSILKKNKNVFADIINDMTVKTLRDNTITFVDFKGNEIIAEIDDSNILFRFDDKIDDMLYSKPIALVKKISRRLKSD